jgi:hypothetical protein
VTNPKLKAAPGGNARRSRRSAIGRSVGLALLLPAVLFLGGCASSTSHVKELASSGVAYGSALDTLLTVTEETALDASSARALSQAQGVKTPARRVEILEGQDKAIALTLGDLEKLRAHARLLKRYFQALANLADKATDETVSKAVAGSAQALEKLGNELGSSRALTAEQKDALGKAAGLVVQGVRERAIARELEARANVIDRQLQIHQELLLALRKKLKADSESVYDIGYARDIRRPFESDTIAGARDWISQRRAYLLMDRSIDALEKAADAASRLRSAWKACVENRLDAGALADAMSQIDSAVALAETMKASRS